MTASRLLSTTGAETYKRYFCQIEFSSATYTTVTTTICIDVSNPATSQRKNYGTGLKYDPITGVHFITHNSNLAISTTSKHAYQKINLATGTVIALNPYYNTFISNAGVFTNKPLVTLTNGF